MDVEGTDMDVGLALGAAFSIRNACEMAARQREAARARQKERAAGGGGAPRARGASRLVAARSSSRWTVEMLAISSAVRGS